MNVFEERRLGGLAVRQRTNSQGGGRGGGGPAPVAVDPYPNQEIKGGVEVRFTGVTGQRRMEATRRHGHRDARSLARSETESRSN